MLVLTVSFERKCDFVGFLVSRNISGISGMSERFAGKKSIVEIYSESDMKDILAEVVADYISGPYRRSIADDCLSSECPFIGDEERNIILDEVPVFKYESWVRPEVADFIKDNDYIDVPGFVRFRLPSFSRDIMADTSKVCENFLKKREFEEMVALLKYHISCSNPSGTVKLTFSEDGYFTIVYPDGRKATPQSAESGADAVLGMLMVMIPEKIEVYNRGLAKDGVLSAIEAVFENSVKYMD